MEFVKIPSDSLYKFSTVLSFILVVSCVWGDLILATRQLDNSVIMMKDVIETIEDDALSKADSDAYIKFLTDTFVKSTAHANNFRSLMNTVFIIALIGTAVSIYFWYTCEQNLKDEILQLQLRKLRQETTEK